MSEAQQYSLRQTHRQRCVTLMPRMALSRMYRASRAACGRASTACSLVSKWCVRMSICRVCLCMRAHSWKDQLQLTATAYRAVSAPTRLLYLYDSITYQTTIVMSIHYSINYYRFTITYRLYTYSCRAKSYGRSRVVGNMIKNERQNGKRTQRHIVVVCGRTRIYIYMYVCMYV